MTNKSGAGKSVLITGAAGGIGRALCVGFAAQGYEVIASDIPAMTSGLHRTCELVEANGSKGHLTTGDVTSKDDCDRMVSEAISWAGNVDVLVNCAGILHAMRLEDLSGAEWDAHIAVNSRSVLFMTQAVLPHMRKRHYGRIINIASLAARQGIPTEGHYAASKAAVVTLTRVFAQELGEDGINVNAICPGIIMTEMAMNKLDGADQVKAWEQMTALKRLGKPEDVVGPACFLASEQSDFVTGQALNVCGGLYFH